MNTRLHARSQLVAVPVLAVVFLWAASPCAAQAPRSLEVRPSIGSTFFLSEVGETSPGSRGSLESAVGYGLDLGLPFGFGDLWGFDVNLRYTPTEISVRRDVEVEGEDREVELAVGFDANLYAAGLSVTRYFVSGRNPLFISAGAGVKRYTGAFVTTYDAMWNIGGGIIFESDVARFRISLRNFMSVFDDAEPERFQHDLMLSTAIVITPF